MAANLNFAVIMEFMLGSGYGVFGGANSVFKMHAKVMSPELSIRQRPGESQARVVTAIPRHCDPLSGRSPVPHQAQVQVSGAVL